MPDKTVDQSGQTVHGSQINAGGDVNVGRIGDDIHTNGGDFVARDKIIHIHQAPAEPEIPRLPYEPETIIIPAGSFLMGSEPAPGIPEYETPQYEVVLPAFRIGRRPVTNAEYYYFLQHTKQTAVPELRWEYGTRPSPDQEEQPVSGVTWHEALAYCDWLKAQTRRAYTLPSEAQWERVTWEQVVIETSGPFVIGEVSREWTTTLWGEERRRPDPRYSGCWRPDDGRDDLITNDQVRRVTRGGGVGNTRRTSELPNSRGLTSSRLGFRIVLNQEG